MKTKPKTPPTRKPAKGRKQTGDKVSRIAARILAIPPQDFTLYVGRSKVTLGDLKALAASCLAQDETKGHRAKRARKGRK